jgi:sugar lactone lactonase YvrE
MHGAENIYLDTSSPSIYVTDLSGTIYLVNESGDGKLFISASIDFGELATGIIEGKDGFLYAGGSRYPEKDYLREEGGSVFRIDKELNRYEILYSAYRGINGLATDSDGHLYFTTGNLKFLSPEGALYKMSYDPAQNTYGKPVKVIDSLGSANGLYYSEYYDALIITETFSGISKIDLSSNTVVPLLNKSKMVEGFDDVTVDSKGRIWVAEPVGGFIKVFDPAGKKLTRFRIEGLGVASSCRIRMDKNHEEVIYICERQHKKNNDGRGLITISINQLFED